MTGNLDKKNNEVNFWYWL